jgi:hypothetical protein
LEEAHTFTVVKSWVHWSTSSSTVSLHTVGGSIILYKLTYLKQSEKEKTKKGKESALIDKGMVELILITTETVVMNS